MSKTLKKNGKKTSNNYFEDGYHSKQSKKATEHRKQMKQFENALRSRDLNRILTYEDQL
jgi:hypothetical protein